MNIGIIYIAYCVISRKRYIGKTEHFRRRRYAHEYASKKSSHRDHDSKFHRAIRKYGLQNFIWIVIERGISKEDLAEKEKEYINIFDSFKKGYNSTIGGDGSFGYRHTEASKNASSLKKKGKTAWNKGMKDHLFNDLFVKNNPMKDTNVHKIWIEKYGQERADELLSEMREKQRESGKQRSREDRKKAAIKMIATKKANGSFAPEKNPMYGKKHSEETKEKIRIAAKKRRKNKKEVVQ